MERHTQKDHGLTEKGNVIENSAGIAIFTTEALVKEKVSETRAKRLLHQCEKCQYSTVQKAHLRRHIQNKHDGRTKPEMRGRKTKTGPISDRTKRRRNAESGNKLTERDVSFLVKNMRVSERDLNKVVKFTKEKMDVHSMEIWLNSSKTRRKFSKAISIQSSESSMTRKERL